MPDALVGSAKTEDWYNPWFCEGSPEYFVVVIIEFVPNSAGTFL